MPASPIAIIPAAGVGTRLRPHTYTQPKVLLHVAGKPMLAHILDELPGLGIQKVVLIVGYILTWSPGNWALTFYVSSAIYLMGAVCWLFIDACTPIDDAAVHP